MDDVHSTHTASEQNFQLLCAALQLSSTSDEALFHIASALVEANCSSRYAALFLESSVRPKIQQASSVITRMLLQAALLFGARYGSILADSIVVPMLCGDEKSIGSAQAEAITRILRSDNAVPRDQIDDLVRQTLESANAKASQVGAEAPRHLLTNESVLLVFQNVFAAKPALAPRTVELFVAACELALDGDGGADLESSLKFATAIFTLISKYPEQCAVHVEALETITKRLKSLMAKTTMRFLQKLKR